MYFQKICFSDCIVIQLALNLNSGTVMVSLILKKKNDTRVFSVFDGFLSLDMGVII